MSVFTEETRPTLDHEVERYGVARYLCIVRRVKPGTKADSTLRHRAKDCRQLYSSEAKADQNLLRQMFNFNDNCITTSRVVIPANNDYVLALYAEANQLSYCAYHPDRETSYICSKHNIYMCDACMRCRDPEIYCKFRTSCPIHFLTKRKGNLDNDTAMKKDASSDN